MDNENTKVGRKSKNDLYNAAFAVRLRELFEKNNITQANFAEKLGITRQTVGNWLLGKSQPDFETLVKIADHFETTTDYLLGRTENKTTDIKIQSISEYTGLSDQAIKVLHLFDILKKTDINRNSQKKTDISSRYSDGNDTYELSHSKKIYEIDYIDWYLKKMERWYPMLRNIVFMVNVNQVKSKTYHATVDDIAEIIYEKCPELADLIFSAGTIVTGVQYRQILLNECKDQYEQLLQNFADEFSPFEELHFDNTLCDILYGGYYDLETEVKNKIEFLKISDDRILKDIKDGEPDGND